MVGPQGQIAYPMQQQQYSSPYGGPPPSPMGGYQAPYGQQNTYADVVKNVAPPPNYYSQQNPQQGYRGPQ